MLTVTRAQEVFVEKERVDISQASGSPRFDQEGPNPRSMCIFGPTATRRTAQSCR